MSDYFTLALPTSTESFVSLASTPIHTSDALLPHTKDAEAFRDQLPGLAPHLVETPHGNMDEQRLEECVREMDMLEQELEMALSQAQEELPDTIQ